MGYEPRNRGRVTQRPTSRTTGHASDFSGPVANGMLILGKPTCQGKSSRNPNNGQIPGSRGAEFNPSRVAEGEPWCGTPRNHRESEDPQMTQISQIGSNRTCLIAPLNRLEKETKEVSAARSFVLRFLRRLFCSNVRLPATQKLS